MQKKAWSSCPEISFLKSDDVDAFTILAGREFQIGITRDEKKYLRRLVRVRGMVSLNGWPRVSSVTWKLKKVILNYCNAIMNNIVTQNPDHEWGDDVQDSEDSIKSVALCNFY